MTIKALKSNINSKHKQYDYDWEVYFQSANRDFASTLVLWYAGFANNTATWLMMHTIEKYLKCYLIYTKQNSNCQVKKFNHNLAKLTQEFKKTCNARFSDDIINQKLDIFLDDLDTIKDNVRYGETSIYTSGEGLYLFIIFCSFIRYLMLKRQNYQETFYGLLGLIKIPDYTNGKDSSIGFRIISKMLHLCLEHGMVTNNSGSFANNYFFGIQTHPRNFAYLHNNCAECPICSKKPCNQQTLSSFYRGI